MHRDYLDWNIITSIKKPSNEIFEELASLLKEQKGSITIPYSTAHISDLTKDYHLKSDVDKEYIERDFQFLSDISEDLCIGQFHNKPQISTFYESPKEYFERNYSGEEEIEPVDDLFDFSADLLNDGEEGEALNKKMTEAIKSLKEIDFSDINEALLAVMPPESRGKFLTRSKEDSNGYNFILDVAEYFQDIQGISNMYQFQRKTLRETKLINTDSLKEGEVIQGLNDILAKSSIGKSFDDLVNDIQSNRKNGEQNQLYSQFRDKYFMLDVVGVSPEKFSEKNKFTNFLDDVSHAFYGAHCDVYVTNDSKSLKKAKEVYSNENITTLALSPSEYILLLKKRKNENLNFEGLMEKLSRYINSKIEGIPTINVCDVSSFAFSLEGTFLNYFNHCLPMKLDSFVCFNLYKEQKTYSQFTFTNEMRGIIKSLFEIFKEDANGKGLMTLDDEANIKENEVIIRQWNLSVKYSIVLKFEHNQIVIGIIIFDDDK